jgi:Uma2 family endonuclease
MDGDLMIAKLKIPADEQRLRLSLVPWQDYVAICDAMGERRLRVTYDQGELEIMSLSRKHERSKKRLALLVETLTDELEIGRDSGGSMTCRNEAMARALEPDDCFWIQNEALVRGRDELDLDVDPPPDLSLEIEISRSMLNRMAIYAALKVPEVWRWNGETLTVHLLGSRGSYRVSKRSKVFPFLPMDEIAAFLKRTELNDTMLVAAFRRWVREHKDEWAR